MPLIPRSPYAKELVGVGLRFNPPPGWPPAPEGFTPQPGWQPDPSWPQPPVGWQLWVNDDQAPADSSYFFKQKTAYEIPGLPYGAPSGVAGQPQGTGRTSGW